MVKRLSQEEIKLLKEEAKAAHGRVVSQATALRNEYKKQVSAAIITALGWLLPWFGRILLLH